MHDSSFSRLSLAALAFGLLLSLAAGYAADRLWQERLLREFQARAADVLDLAEQQLNRRETPLKTVYSHYEAKRWTRSGFRQYLRGLQAQAGLARLELVYNDRAAPYFGEDWARLELADGGARKTLVWHAPMRPLGGTDYANPKEAVEAGFDLGKLFGQLFEEVRLGGLKARVYLEGEGIPERYARFEPAYATADGVPGEGDLSKEKRIQFAAAALRLLVYAPPPPAWTAHGPGIAAAALGFLLNLLLLRALHGRHLHLLQAHERAVALYERGEAAAFIVHELPQPLTGVIGCLGGLLLWLERGGAPPEVLRRDLEQARDSALRMDELLEDLRRHVKHDADTPAPVPIAPLLRKVAALARLDPRMGGLAPTVAADGAGLQVFASPIALEMLLLNLLRNAAEAIRDAGAGGAVSLEAWEEEGKVLLRVCDDGPGLADPGGLFEPFRTTKPYGSGLGLVYCQRQARRFGGGIEGGNRPQGGARFTVTLPRWSAGRAPDA